MLKQGTLILALVTFCEGCAMQPPIPREPVHRLAVLEVQPTVADRALRRVMHGGQKQVAPNALAVDRRRINVALAAALTEDLPCLAPPDIAAAEDYPDADQMGRPLGSATLERLQASHAADAYLRLRITDYGETPRRWRGAYVTFEVVTTLGIAAALYAHKVTRAVAGAYLLEESIEELSEGYAGFWVLNRLSRPVRIEADLLDGETGELLASETHVGLARWRWRHLWHMDDIDRDELLEISLQKALKPFTDHGRSLCRP